MIASDFSPMKANKNRRESRSDGMCYDARIYRPSGIYHRFVDREPVTKVTGYHTPFLRN